MDVIAAVPIPAIGFNNPLPPNAPDFVPAIAVFGNPSAKLGLPLTISPVLGWPVHRPVQRRRPDLPNRRTRPQRAQGPQLHRRTCQHRGRLRRRPGVASTSHSNGRVNSSANIGEMIIRGEGDSGSSHPPRPGCCGDSDTHRDRRAHRLLIVPEQRHSLGVGRVPSGRGGLRPRPAGTSGHRRLGNAFVSALRSEVNKNIGVYAVHYPADNQIDVGANDMSAHIQNMANNCPDTRLVLGGYSLGAAVTDVVLALPFAFFGFDNPVASGHGPEDRRRRAVRQRLGLGRAHHELQPDLLRTNHRVVPRRGSDLQPGRSEHVGEELDSTTQPRPTSTRAW